MSGPTPRTKAIRAMFDTSGRGLEVGASYNPIVSKRDGFQVDVVDHASAADLRAKYASDPSVDIANIEEVDHIWDGRPLREVIGHTACYDYIVASHVIEHMPDMLGFLIECDALLKPGGTLFLAVPDKRRCFDALRHLTSTGDVLQAHHERRKVHSPATAFDFVANVSDLDGINSWGQYAHGTLKTKHSLPAARDHFARSTISTAYFDFHAGVYTPSSFRLILRDLNEIEALKLREINFRATGGSEFYLTLSRTGAGCLDDRLTLMRTMRRELNEDPEIAPPPQQAARSLLRRVARRILRR